MFSVVNQISRLPWWLFVVAGIFFTPLALAGYVNTKAAEAEKAAALASPGPELVDLGLFRAGSDIGIAGEVNLAVQVNGAYTKELMSGETMIVLFGAADGQDETAARAVIFAEDGEAALSLLNSNVLGTGQFGPIYHLNGTVALPDSRRAEIDREFAKAGLTMAAQFVVADPFLFGRAAHFAPSAANPMIMPLTQLSLGALFIFFGLRNRKRDASHRKDLDALMREHEGAGIPAQ